MDQYKCVELICTALYGSVLKCQHQQTKEMVAIKLIELKYAAKKISKRTNTMLQEDIFIELETNMKIKKAGGHPNVVALKECHMNQHVLALVMEYCANGELLQILNDRPHMTSFQIMRYFLQIAQGVAFLHTNGIAHRDLSLENILVNEKDCCQITDFGLVAPTNTPYNPSVGKTIYAAPEAYQTKIDKRYTNEKADIWALGVMLFTMFTGKYPFTEANARCYEFRLLKEYGIKKLLEKLKVDTNGCPEIVDLLGKLLMIDPLKRPSSAEVLLHPCFIAFKETSSNPSDTEANEDNVSKEQARRCIQIDTIQKQQCVQTFVSIQSKRMIPFFQVSKKFQKKISQKRKKFPTDQLLKAFKSLLRLK
jgi:serine/threonine protein kinase